MHSFYTYGFTFFFLLGSMQLFGQPENQKTDTADTSKGEGKGKFSGQARYYFMATNNQRPLTDYYAHALSIQGKYETGKWKGFSLAAGAATVFNLLSSDLEKIDPATGRSSRYEVGLFDLRHPNKTSGFRPEELYLQYTLPNGFVRAGSQAINTPFINPQDGRMRPNFVSGIYAKQTFPATELEGGWIGGMLPRSINRWHGVASSIGLYPQGSHTDGTAANFSGYLSSKGILLAGVHHTIAPGVNVKLWEQFAENIFNTALLQVDGEKPLNEKTRFMASLQYVHQIKIKNGGSNEGTNGYFQSAAPAQVISAMSGIKAVPFEVSVNYTRILTDARFLMPREWGREPFFTFMPRERSEGLGNAQAFVIKTAYYFPKAGLKTSLQAGRFLLADVKNVALNKYGMPSYNQVNAEVRYTPKCAPILELQALYVYKNNKGNIYEDPAYIFNKVNMSLFHLVLNYTW